MKKFVIGLYIYWFVGLLLAVVYRISQDVPMDLHTYLAVAAGWPLWAIPTALQWLHNLKI